MTEIERTQFDALVAAGHEGLRSASVGRYPAADLAALSVFPALEELAVTDSYHLGTLAGLGSLPRLRALELALCRRLASLADVVDASALRRLEVTSCTKVTDLAPLARLGELTLVEIDARRPPALAPLAGHPSLAYVRVTGGPADGDDVAALVDGAGAALRLLQVRQAVWWRAGGREGSWEHVPNVYALSPEESATYEALMTEVDGLRASP